MQTTELRRLVASRRAGTVLAVLFLGSIMLGLMLSVSGCGKDNPTPPVVVADPRIGFVRDNVLYSIKLDGTDETALATSTYFGQTSPDGQKILFVSNQSGTTGIYTMNKDGSGQTLIRETPGIQYSDTAWSPDGQKIAFIMHDDSDEIYVMNADGTGFAQITFQGGSVWNGMTWSHDSGKIAYDWAPTGDNMCQIYRVNVDGSGLTRLTNNNYADYGPDWSADGAKIVFYRSGQPGYELITMNGDGSQQTNISNSEDWESTAVWSPDCTKIVYRRGLGNTADEYELFVMNADGSNQTRLTYILGAEIDMRWSPDGSKITYAGRRAGTYYVYAMNADGSGQTQLSGVPGEHSMNPFWIP